MATNIGMIMLITAVLDVTSVKNATNTITKKTTAVSGRAFSILSFSPMNCDNPDVCNCNYT